MHLLRRRVRENTEEDLRLIERKWIGKVVLLGIFGLCMYYLAVSANNPFLYFNF